jgi:uncharacterized protein
MTEPEIYEPDDPREWLREAREDLTIARATLAGVGLRPLCFHAQQAAEKAVKAVFIARRYEYPYIHDLGILLRLLEEDGVDVPCAVRRIRILNRYATAGRYPGRVRVTHEKHERALRLADGVLAWATQQVSRRPPRVGERRAEGYARPAAGSAAPSPELLEEIVACIVQAVAPERIILFGSGARGTMGPHSDLDLLVVKAGRYDADSFANRIEKALGALRVPFDIVLARPDQLERYGASIGLVYRPALREGRVLYVRKRGD